MVGGGSDAFIGAVHRMGACLDNQIELVCGAFSSDPDKSKKSGKDLYLPEGRVYTSYHEMMEKEATLSEEARMDFVSIVTPNHMHYPPAILALDNGFPVVIDKPLTFTYEEAVKLKEKVQETRFPFAVTYTYAAYPMIKQAREMVQNSEIGNIRKIMVEYPQGWLTDKLEDTGQKQASWRADPERAGISNCFGDIGTHAANMAEYVSGLKITEVLSEIRSFVPGRILDDDANVLFHLENGANGVISASQVSPGEENNLKFRIYGDKGGLEWNNMDVNTLLVKIHGKPIQIYRAGGNIGYLGEAALAHMRTPAGHAEGYIEAFANIYRNFAFAIRKELFGEDYNQNILDFPGVEEGLRGIATVVAVVKSTEEGNIWKSIEVN